MRATATCIGKLIGPALILLVVSACGGNSSDEPVQSGAASETAPAVVVPSPSEVARAPTPEAAATTPSPAPIATPPTFDPDDPATLVGVWGMQGGHDGIFTFNDAGYWGAVDTARDETIDNGTWELADGILRMEEPSPHLCPAGVSEYRVAAGDEPGHLTLEVVKDPCGLRSAALVEGLAWIGPDD